MAGFERIPEPALMDDPAQVDAYASADWSEAHDRLMRQIAEHFPRETISGLFLNLGCGSGDDTFRFLREFPGASVIAVDGAARMLDHARADLLAKFPEFHQRVEFHQAYIPGADIPVREYAGVISNSLLHHFDDPVLFWAAVREHTREGSRIFVGDLRRPASVQDADHLVNEYARDAPEILREDFRNSLLAAFTPQEVGSQLGQAGLAELKVHSVGDRHMIIAGVRN
ncbi:MAG: class I SAM-dependent methyltransferase [Xanthomonadales bacterium]|nr:class I SAM-dependent methyltransferase [Xanthomonadales bacterium]